MPEKWNFSHFYSIFFVANEIFQHCTFFIIAQPTRLPLHVSSHHNHQNCSYYLDMGRFIPFHQRGFEFQASQWVDPGRKIRNPTRTQPEPNPKGVRPNLTWLDPIKTWVTPTARTIQKSIMLTCTEVRNSIHDPLILGNIDVR